VRGLRLFERLYQGGESVKKGVVLEKTDNFVVVMTPDGNFYKTKKTNRHANIGDEVEFKPDANPVCSWIQSFFRFRYLPALAIVVILSFIPFLNWTDVQEAYAYVSIDINPSVELTINRDLEVIQISAINEDGGKIVNQLKDWKFQSVEMVTILIIEKTREAGYLNPENKDVLIGVSYATNEPSEGIAQKIEGYVISQKEDLEAAITAFEIPMEVRKEAKEEEISMNYAYAQKLIEEQDIEIIEQEKDISDTEVEASEDRSMNVEKTEKTDKKEEVEQKIIEKFIHHVDQNDITLPPGIAKKVELIKSSLEPYAPNLKPKKERQEKTEESTSFDQKQTNHSNQGESGIQKGNSDKPVPPVHKNNDALPPGLEKKKDEIKEKIEEELESNSSEIEEALEKAEEILSDENIRSKLDNLFE
jgi:hypothetical protein